MLESPAQLGPYRLDKRLGHGGMCEVFRATVFGASGFEKTVALKVLLAQYRQNAAYQRQFLREARLGARLSHQNLVGVHDFGVADGVQYLRMDFVDGCDLKTLAAKTPLGAGLAVFIAAEIALGLDYLHGCTDTRGRPMGLVHRDVSPSNVLISRHGEVMLADFGILKATAYEDLTRGGVRKGTYAFMSPEQIAGETLTHRSDQFALGLLLAELVGGAHPFEAADVVSTMERIERADAPDLCGLDDVLEPLVRRCLLREPTERYADMATLYGELRDLKHIHYPEAGPLALKR